MPNAMDSQPNASFALIMLLVYSQPGFTQIRGDKAMWWFLLFVITLLLKLVVIVLLALMGLQLLEVAGRGRNAALLKREDTAVKLHRESADMLVRVIAAEVATVLTLELLVRSSRNYLAEPTTVLWLHLLSVLLFVGTVLGMRYLLPGTTHAPVLVLLGRYAVWAPFWVMAVTGVILIAKL
jgi:hypothetical protein